MAGGAAAAPAPAPLPGAASRKSAHGGSVPGGQARACRGCRLEQDLRMKVFGVRLTLALLSLGACRPGPGAPEDRKGVTVQPTGPVGAPAISIARPRSAVCVCMCCEAIHHGAPLSASTARWIAASPPAPRNDGRRGGVGWPVPPPLTHPSRGITPEFSDVIASAAEVLLPALSNVFASAVCVAGSADSHTRSTGVHLSSRLMQATLRRHGR